MQNRAPSASVTDSPDPAPIGTPVTFDASGSTDPDGTIVKYEWDLDGNGTYETNTGSTPTATKSYSKPAEVQVGVKVTDNEGLTATATQTARIVGTYYGVIKGTPGLLDYWRLGERTGTTFADSVGANNATMTGTVTLGSPGAIPTDPNSSATFPGGGGGKCSRRPLRHLSGDARILAQLERLPEQRPAGVRVHPELQFQRRWVPGRPECR